MKIFITEDKRYIKKFKDTDILVYSYEDALPYLLKFIEDTDDISFDIETTGLNAYTNDVLLYGIGNKVDQYIIHKPKVENCTEPFLKIKELNKRVLGHNVKFDSSFVYTNENILLENFYDTMIAEQRIWQRMDVSFSYEAVVYNYLKEKGDEVDKRIRNEFIGANPEYFTVEQRHIDYLVGDLDKLEDIKNIQDKLIYKYNLYNLIYKVEFPLIPIIANAELRGFEFDFPKWKSVYEEHIVKQLETAQELDALFRKLRDETDFEKEDTKYRCRGGKYDRERVKSPLLKLFEVDGTPKGEDLFGNPLNSKQVTGVKKKINFYPNNTNYGSPTQIMELFAFLGEPLPNKQREYEIPEFNSKGKIDKSRVSYVTNKDALEQYLIDIPKTRMTRFIKLLIDYGKYSTLINNFGVNYKSKINPVTGHLHTEFRQCRAATGRFQSGGGKKQPDKPNFQNIPKIKELRNCFKAREGYSIITADYSGAELIVMCSLSQDMKLLEYSKGDMHSTIATKCWRNVYKFRAKTYLKQITSKNSVIPQQELEKLYNENVELSNTFVVDKSTEEKQLLRTQFKPVTFGVIYGLRARGLGEELSISEDEAQVIIDTLKKTFPKVFRMVEEAADFALQHGYLILNGRTKSRAYFPNIIRMLRGEYNMKDHFKEIMDDVNKARNIRIQGTQADFIKESSVVFSKYLKQNNIDANILSWVHDEIITECPLKYDGQSEEYKTWKKINPKQLTYKGKNKTYEGLSLPEVKEIIMNETANRYLSNVTINTDYSVNPYWTKD